MKLAKNRRRMGLHWLAGLGALLGFAGCQLSSSQTGSYSYQEPYAASGTWEAKLEAAKAGESISGKTAQLGRSLGTGVKAIGGKVACALEIQPRITPADDPASLACIPADMEPAVYVQFAHAAEQQSNPAAAKRYFGKALQQAEDDVATLVAYARFCDRQRLTETALAAYERAREADPAEALVLNDLGLLYARHGQLDKAADHLQQAVVLQPENVRYRNNLAHVLIATERFDAAVQILAVVLPAATAHYNVAILLQDQGRAKEAFLHLARAVELDPNYAPALDMLARSQAQTYAARLPGGDAS